MIGGRVHRLDQLSRKKPAKLLGYQALTLIKGASRFGPVFLVIQASEITATQNAAICHTFNWRNMLSYCIVPINLKRNGEKIAVV
jgi:hypothetical protein